MLKVDDIIEVNFNFLGTKSKANGKIVEITFKEVKVQLGFTEETIMIFDAEDGTVISEDPMNSSFIDIYNIDIPDNPFERVKYRMNEEGFHYCFEGYSNWTEIDDPIFHALRENYLEATKRLRDYVNNEAS